MFTASTEVPWPNESHLFLVQKLFPTKRSLKTHSFATVQSQTKGQNIEAAGQLLKLGNQAAVLSKQGKSSCKVSASGP